MHVLTAPNTDDPRPGGFVDTIPGELLVRSDNRTWRGLSSHHGTTLARVTDRDITADAYRALVVAFLTDVCGWDRATAEHDARVLTEIAADLDIGAGATLDDHDTAIPVRDNPGGDP